MPLVDPDGNPIPDGKPKLSYDKLILAIFSLPILIISLIVGFAYQTTLGVTKYIYEHSGMKFLVTFFSSLIESVIRGINGPAPALVEKNA